MCDNETNKAVRRMLFIINTVQFLLCAAQITVHGIFLFIVFTVITGDVLAYLHHVNPYIITANTIFNVNVSLFVLVSPFVADWLACSMLLETHYRFVQPKSTCHLHSQGELICTDLAPLSLV